MATVRKIQDLGYTQWRHIMNGIVLIVVALLFIFYKDSVPKVILGLGINLLATFRWVDVLTYIFRRKLRQKASFVTVFIKAVILSLLSLGTAFETVTVTVVVILCALYQLLLAVMNGITYWIYKKDGTPGRLRYLRGTIIYTLLAFPALFSPTIHIQGQFFILGIYLFNLGCTRLMDGILFNRQNTNTLKRRVRVSLPIVLVALVPSGVLSKINDYLQGHEAFDAERDYNQVKDETLTAEVEVFVHTSDKNGLFGAMGHVDVAYNGRVYSYGNYDVLSERLFGSVGDGILFSVPKDAYIEMCLHEENKTLFSYGLDLTPKQQKAFEDELNELMHLTVPFTPSAEPIVDKNGVKEPMYLSYLKTQLGADVYKFTQSKFKTYFVLSTNCVLLADTLLGKTGTDVLSVKGFIAPGTYQEYLDREYERPNSMVISRKVYFSQDRL